MFQEFLKKRFFNVFILLFLVVVVKIIAWTFSFDFAIFTFFLCGIFGDWLVAGIWYLLFFKFNKTFLFAIKTGRTIRASYLFAYEFTKMHPPLFLIKKIYEIDSNYKKWEKIAHSSISEKEFIKMNAQLFPANELF